MNFGVTERQLIILGGGGHAKVLIYTLRLCGRVPIGYTDPAASQPIAGVPHLGHDESVFQYGPEEVTLVNGLGGVGGAGMRIDVFEMFKDRGYAFLTVIHPSAIIAPDVQINEGAQVLAGAVVLPGSVIGPNAIINTRASVDHDCVIETHAHIAPGAILSGGVRIERGAHVGTGACIIQGKVVGQGATVGAGGVVVRNVPAGVTVVGVPAKLIGSNTDRDQLEVD